MLKNLPISNRPNNFNIKKTILIAFMNFAFILTDAQNSMVGDGFGGRLWYKPYNYSTGSYSAYTICGDSAQLYGWGDNEYGQLGNGTFTSTETPTKVPGMTNALYYSTGYIMGAIKKNKTGWVWGKYAGNVPVKVIDKVKFLDAGMIVCTFVKNDGTVWSVGQNSTGSFGNGEQSENIALVPVKMKGINTAVRVANSGMNNIILLKDGTVMCAGLNFNNTKSLIPTQIHGLQNIIDIKANKRGVVALDKDGNIFTWGDGLFGALGNGTENTTDKPIKLNTLKNIVAISGCNDGEHFLALDSGHNCYAWGYNGYGQCGVKDVKNLLSPKLIANDVMDIMAGELFSYIIKNDGELWACGSSRLGSIWMNRTNVRRYLFSRLNPDAEPMNMCKTEHLATKIYKSYEIALCRGDSFKIGDKCYNSTGKYQDTILKDTCMDTIYSIQISFRKTVSRNQQISLCSGESIKVGNILHSVSGTFTDTISNYFGCDSIVISSIKVLPVSMFNQHAEFCEGGRFRVGSKYYLHSGTYLDTFPNYHGCDSVVKTQLVVNALPVADFKFGSNAIKTDEAINFINLSSGADQFVWHFDNHQSLISTDTNPLYTYRYSGQKNVALIAIQSQSECMDTIVKSIDITDNTDVYIPDVFTPNGDGINDYFNLVSRNYDVIQLSIYNRWGEEIFQGDAFLPGWDGRTNGEDSPQDVYTYVINLSQSSTNKNVRFHGTLTLLR